MERVLTLAALFWVFQLPGSIAAPAEDAVISQWLSRQTNISTWAADFRQTRTIKNLTQPLISTGQVWFAAPHNFRWELGSNQTIALRREDEMTVVYPRLKRVEIYEFDAGQKSQWKDTLALLQSGFPTSRVHLEKQFDLQGIVHTNQSYRIELRPNSPAARKIMPLIHVFVSATNFNLAGTELIFSDGSSMRNDFFHVRTNVEVSGKFEFSVPAGFKVEKPLKN